MDNPLQLFWRIKKLGMASTVLHVGAHPDDEDIGLLSYIAWKHFGRAIYWSATRGEGGQNRVNSYSGKTLGIYRTWESLEAREIDGGESIFGPFMDFGFSKNANDTFSRWGKENIVKEMVRVIRMTQPLVVVSRWSGTPEDGHGQHQAVGQAIIEAFDLANSQEIFPELLKEGLAPWQPLKLYLSTNKDIFSSGKPNPQLDDKEGVLKINTGEFEPLLGCTYQEQAWNAYKCHQTQGIEALPMPNDFFYYFILLRSHISAPTIDMDIFGGLDPTLTGITCGIPLSASYIKEILEEVKKQVYKASKVFRPEDPLPLSLPLCKGLRLLRALYKRIVEEHVPSKGSIIIALDRKIKEFEEAIAGCLGLRLESVCTRGRVTPGESVWVKSKVWNHRNLSIDKTQFNLQLPKGFSVERGEGSDNLEDTDLSMIIKEVFIGNDAELSSPIWLKESARRYVYESSDTKISQLQNSPASLKVECYITMGDDTITLNGPVIHRKAFPGGYRGLPLKVVPPISLHPEYDKRILLSSDADQYIKLQVTARCNDEERPAKGHLELIGPGDWGINPDFEDFTLPQLDSMQECAFNVTIPANNPEGEYVLKYKICCRQRDYNVILTPVLKGTPGLPNPLDPATSQKEELLLEPARVTVHIIEARYIDSLRYAYIEGAKEKICTTLQSIGIDFHLISDSELAYGDLDLFDAIIVGPNAYLLRSELRENAQRILEYVKNGGNLVVQYQGYGYQKHGLAPYPFKYRFPHDRVTDENAPVKILLPEDPLFHYPNHISDADFTGWIHDRGLYFFKQWDKRYVPLISCADPGEPQQMGGLMKCQYGLGTYIYVGYSFFRQVPAGVPGACRLFFNILSLGCAEDRTV